MSFYRFRQNNSGGSFDQTRELDKVVYVEADSAEQANTRAKALGIYFDGVETDQDCECCGDRWYAATKDDASNEPDLYPRFDRGAVVVHLANGVIARPR